MKHLTYLFMTVLTVTSLCSAAINTDKLEEAIDQSALSRVKVLLKKTEDETITLQERKKVLGRLYDHAEEVAQERVSSMSLIGDWRDAARTTVGSLFVVGFGLGLYEGVRETSPGLILGSTLLGALGGYLLYKGITCASQKVLVDQSKAVEKVIKSKLREVEADSE